MPAVSKKQQRYFGYLLSNPEERKKKGISKKAAKDFAQDVKEGAAWTKKAGKNKDFADRAKKAGYKSTQDYANVVARYGSEDNMKKGRGLGT